MNVYLPMIFCFVKIKGKSNFEKGENYVVIFNHNSMMDIPVSTIYTPGANKTLGKVELTKVPLFNIIYRAGAVIVDRKSINSRKESLGKMEDVLKMGLHLCLFPEGTRNKTEQPLLPFFDGAFNTAIRAQKAIIPTVLFNTKKVYSSKNKFWGWPHTIHLHFLEPVSTKGLTTDNTAELKARIRNLMENYYVNNEKYL
jgi:1-acyl-sn-glycerol-3-phosphate acyltransferase